MTLILGKKKCLEGLNVCINYELNLLHHVGVVAKRRRLEGDDNTPSGACIWSLYIIMYNVRYNFT